MKQDNNTRYTCANEQGGYMRDKRRLEPTA